MQIPVTSVTAIPNTPAMVVDGISIYKRDDYNESFEADYTTTTEPWEYSRRGAELYRHQYTVKQLTRFQPAPGVLLELGCSKGLMTELLMPVSKSIYAADISLTALKACKLRCDAQSKSYNCTIDYFVTTTPGLPFAEDSFDVVTICDGLTGWYLHEPQKKLALQDVHRVLKKGGIAILTDCLMPEINKGEFEAYEAMVRESPLTVKEVTFLYDKPWYTLESLLKKTGLARFSKGLMSNISIAKALNSVGRMIGKKASRHIVIIVQKR